MTAWLTLLYVTGGLVALGMLLDYAPKIIRARADSRLMRDHGIDAAGRYELEDVTLAVVTAIRRTDADLSLELVERIADSILEDLEHGVLTIGAPDQGPGA